MKRKTLSAGLVRDPLAAGFYLLMFEKIMEVYM